MEPRGRALAVPALRVAGAVALLLLTAAVVLSVGGAGVFGTFGSLFGTSEAQATDRGARAAEEREARRFAAILAAPSRRSVPRTGRRRGPGGTIPRTPGTRRPPRTPGAPPQGPAPAPAPAPGIPPVGPGAPAPEPPGGAPVVDTIDRTVDQVAEQAPPPVRPLVEPVQQLVDQLRETCTGLPVCP